MKKSIVCSLVILSGFSVGSAVAGSSTLCQLGGVLKVLSTESKLAAVRFPDVKPQGQGGLKDKLNTLSNPSDRLALKLLKKAGPNEKYNVSLYCADKSFNFTCLRTEDSRENSGAILCVNEQEVK